MELTATLGVKLAQDEEKRPEFLSRIINAAGAKRYPESFAGKVKGERAEKDEVDLDAPIGGVSRASRERKTTSYRDRHETQSAGVGQHER
jgi:hypothetical protein